MNFQEVVNAAVHLAVLNATPEACSCSRTEIRERTIRGGAKQFVRQCLDCGEPVGNPVKQSGYAPEFDEGLRESARERNAEIREKVRKAENDAWWGKYKEYMESEEWRSLRAKVLERDGFMCQGCLTKRARQVHHRTYENFGNEFAFELVSLCNECHERFHAD